MYGLNGFKKLNEDWEAKIKRNNEERLSILQSLNRFDQTKTQ